MHERSELEEKTQLRFFEVVRRLLLIPTARRVLAALAVLGVMIVPLATFFAFFLEERWGMDAGARALLSAFFAVAGDRRAPVVREDRRPALRAGAGHSSCASAAWLHARADRADRPRRDRPGVRADGDVLRHRARCSGSCSVSRCSVPLLGIIPASMRPHAAALSAIYLAGVGGIGGALLLGTIDRRFGVAGAMVAVAIPGVVGVAAAAQRVQDRRWPTSTGRSTSSSKRRRSARRRRPAGASRCSRAAGSTSATDRCRCSSASTSPWTTARWSRCSA